MTATAIPLATGGYVLSGRKRYITNAGGGRFGIVIARVRNGGAADAPAAFIVERDTGGLQVVEIDHMPMRAVSCAGVTSDNCDVPAGRVLGDVGRGLAFAMAAINRGRLNVAAGRAGLSQACLDASVRHVTERSQFGKSLAHFQFVKQLVVDIATQAHTALLSYRHAAAMLDAGTDARAECSIAKLVCSQAATVAAAHAVQLHGAAGLMEATTSSACSAIAGRLPSPRALRRSRSCRSARPCSVSLRYGNRHGLGIALAGLASPGGSSTSVHERECNP